jgi:hypothetical protein
VLPVSRLALAVREPIGEDELFVVESASAPLPTLLELGRRVVTAADGSPVPWPELPATDLGAVALLVRRALVGSTIHTDAACPAPGCGERIDVSFTVTDYVDHHRPRRPRGAVAAGDGWWSLTGADVRFRIPTVADVTELPAGEDGGLDERCVKAAGTLTAALAQRVGRALAALAPSLDDLLGGVCPECGHEVTMRFDPIGYTLAELRHAFAGIHAETHALASAYGWPEDVILALPRSRRRRYASLIAEERAVA